MLIICMWWTCVCLFRMILILPLCTLHTAHYITVLNDLPFCSTYSIISSISRFSLDNFVFVFFLDLLKFVFFFSINLVRKLNDLRSRIIPSRMLKFDFISIILTKNSLNEFKYLSMSVSVCWSCSLCFYRVIFNIITMQP